MKIKVKCLVCFLFLMNASQLFCQIGNYQYLRKINTTNENWNKIFLPDDIFKDIKKDFSDIRIYGITGNGDTVETPYLLNEKSSRRIVEQSSFNLINESLKEGIYYYTFLRQEQNIINEIELSFRESNYDRNVKLEGSNDNIDWFLILENYRILSVSNNITNYKFNTLRFGNSNFKYIRLSFASIRKPDLLNASIANSFIEKGIAEEYPAVKFETKPDKKSKQSIIDIELPGYLPVSEVGVIVKENYDYFRPMKIQVAVDSVKRNDQWQFLYRDVISGTITSREKNNFTFPTVITNRIKVIVNNYDNTPLTYERVKVAGNRFEMIIRTTEPAEYYLLYGNSHVYKPQYDLSQFRDKIPENITLVGLGEKINNGDTKKEPSPLFTEKLWLWLIILIVIIFLGGFTLKMIKKE